MFNIFIASPVNYLPFSLRKMIYKRNKMLIGDRTLIGKGFQTDSPENISIGANSLINYNCSFYATNWGG